MQSSIWYEPWLDRAAELRQHATVLRAAGIASGGGIRRRLGRALIDAGEFLVREQRTSSPVRTLR